LIGLLAAAWVALLATVRCCVMHVSGSNSTGPEPMGLVQL
jgi:hypothetical protein